MLREWQRDFIRNVYDPVDHRDRRKIRRALLSIARKNGKTALAAALVLVHLVGPEAKRNGEVYSAATDRNQAGHIYKMAKQIIELDEELSLLCRCKDTFKRISVPTMGTFYASLSADGRRQHGFNPTFVVYDELAQAIDREMYDVLATSFGAQEEGLMLVISTQSSDPLSVMTELCDDAIALESGLLSDESFYGKVYAAPEDADPYDERNWHLANPGLDDFRSLADLRSFAAKAQRSPSAEAAFRNLYLNQRVDGVKAFVTSGDWKACAVPLPEYETLRDLDAVVSLDLSARRDLTAMCVAWRLSDGRVPLETHAFTPVEDLDERSKKDAAQYPVWAKQGWLTTIDAQTVNYDIVAQHLRGILDKYRVKKIVFDRWRIEEFKQACGRQGVNLENYEWEEFGQGFKDMAPALDTFEELVISRKLMHGGNPVLTYCVSSVKTTSDAAGNRKFDKKRVTRRIDAAVAAAMVLAGFSKPLEDSSGSYLDSGEVVSI